MIIIVRDTRQTKISYYSKKYLQVFCDECWARIGLSAFHHLINKTIFNYRL